nr:hypothetical protein [Candidatus Protofrankia datiscae]
MAPVQPAQFGERVVVGEDVVPTYHPARETLPRTGDHRVVHRGHLAQVAGRLRAHGLLVLAEPLGQAVERAEEPRAGEQRGDHGRVARPWVAEARPAGPGDQVTGRLDGVDHRGLPVMSSAGSALAVPGQ